MQMVHTEGVVIKIQDSVLIIPWLDGLIYSDPQSRNNAPYGNGVASKNQNVSSHGMPYFSFKQVHVLHKPFSRDVNIFWFLQSSRPMITTSGYMNRMYHNKLYYMVSMEILANAYDMQNNGRGLVGC